jgi:biopolymer transport protein ExbB/TolQ
MDTPNGFQYALETTGTPGLIIVGALGFLSVLTWSVLLTKWSVLRQARKRNSEYLDLYRKMRHPLDIYEQGLDRRGTPLYSVYAAGARELCLQMLGTSERDGTFSARLRNAKRIAPTQMTSITLSMERAIGEMAVRLEEKMSLLATCVSGAPFLGLLGTVWGVMDTFSAVAASSSGASIQDMAPGVSGALVTTVVGLLIAIPAMFGYNHLMQSIKKMVMLLDHHAAELGAAYERHYVEHSGTASPPAPPPVLADDPAPVPVEMPATPEPSPPETPPATATPVATAPAAAVFSPFTPLLEDADDAAPEPLPPPVSPPPEQPVLSGLEDPVPVPLAKPMRPPNMRRLPFELDEDEPGGEPRALPPAP